MQGRWTAFDGAVSQLRGGGLLGWPLVLQARQRVHDQFRYYSCLYWWESPVTAFARGRGYCVQYNGALGRMLRRVGIPCQLVYASRVRLVDDPSWQMGHVWVRARIDGEDRDVCAGSAYGSVRFEPLTKVRPFGAGVKFLTSVGMAPTVAAAVARSAVTRRPRPTWIHHPFD